MEIFALNEFKNEFEKLIKNNSYRDLEKDIISFFRESTPDSLKTGANLNNSQETPFIKNRIKGRGGYRAYYLMILKDDKLYLMYVHPKTGSKGATNITDRFQEEIYLSVTQAIKENNLFKVTFENGKVKFIHVSDLEKITVAIDEMVKQNSKEAE